MKCLGLDIGSSSIKGAVLDCASGGVSSLVTRSFPQPISGLPAGWVEIEPQHVVEMVREVLTELLATTPDAEAIFCCGQMGGVVLVDSKGTPQCNYLSWRDQRSLQPHCDSKSYVQTLRERWSVPMLESLGNELQPGSATTLLYWLRENERLPSGATPLSIADCVIIGLCQGAPTMHVTQAIGMLDLQASDWHQEAFAALDLATVRLPKLSREVTPSGAFEFHGRQVPVFGAYGDQQCALLGAGLEWNELSLNVSTGSQVSERTKEFTPGRYQSRCFFFGDTLNTVTHLPAGRSLNALIDLLSELARAEGVVLHDVWQTIVQKMNAVTSTNLTADITFFAGPLGDRGSIGNITTENLTVGQLFTAAFRNMVQNYVRYAAWLQPQPSWRALVLSGGLAQSVPVLKRMIAEAFPLPLRDAGNEETLLGLLRLAQAALCGERNAAKEKV